MLPLSDLPPAWTVGKSGAHYLESFNADNLYEKIDGRAESFIQYGVKGMAYAFYHPSGDPSNELQLYVFEMADPLKALGKYGSEKPDEFEPVAIGTEGYSTAGSILFYSGRYYTQIVATQDDPKFTAFALKLAKQVAASQNPASLTLQTSSGANTPVSTVTPATAQSPADSPTPASLSKVPTGVTAAKAVGGEVSPATFFALLPVKGRQGDPKYVAQDVFGYSFFTDVFMADYKDGNVAWQGFLRPYRDANQAKAILEKYIDSVKRDGAKVNALTAEGADEIVVSSNIGLIDVVFRKGNTLAGANGATSAQPAEAFARALAKALPHSVQTLDNAN
jgi:hypothetical protein